MSVYAQVHLHLLLENKMTATESAIWGIMTKVILVKYLIGGRLAYNVNRMLN